MSNPNMQYVQVPIPIPMPASSTTTTATPGRGRGNYRGGRGGLGGRGGQLSSQTRRNRSFDGDYENQNFKKNRPNYHNNNNDNRGHQKNSKNSHSNQAEKKYDLFIGWWSDILSSSATKDAFKSGIYYSCKNPKFFQADDSNWKIDEETFKEVPIRNVFFKYKSDWLVDELLLDKSTKAGKIGEAYLEGYSRIDQTVQKVIKCARPTGSFFFVVGNDSFFEAIVCGYGFQHQAPIIQLCTKGRKSNLDDISDPVRAAKTLGHRIVDIAQKYHVTSSSTSPKSNTLQD